MMMKKRPVNAQSGQALLIFTAALPLILALLALVIDFGGAAMAYHRAQIAVDAAAYAAAQAVDADIFYQSNRLILDNELAARLAGQALSFHGAGELAMTGLFLTNDRIQVQAETYYESIFAQYLGVNGVEIQVWSAAVPAFGIEERGQ